MKVTEVKAAPRLVVRRGKLKSKEIVKLKKSNKSIMGWLTSREGPPMHETQEEMEDMEWADLEKEVMLARVRNRQIEWATTRMSRSLVLEMMNTAVEVMENHHITAMLTSVLEEVWKRVEVTRPGEDGKGCGGPAKSRKRTSEKEKGRGRAYESCFFRREHTEKK